MGRMGALNMAAMGEGGGEVEVTIGDGRVKYEEAFRNHVPLLYLIRMYWMLAR
jgi:hypothetical protein